MVSSRHSLVISDTAVMLLLYGAALFCMLFPSQVATHSWRLLEILMYIVSKLLKKADKKTKNKKKTKKTLNSATAL